MAGVSSWPGVQKLREALGLANKEENTDQRLYIYLGDEELVSINLAAPNTQERATQMNNLAIEMKTIAQEEARNFARNFR